ncbi:hypothetical protein AVEN_214094-1 [Araneus ventricosus]|uniref:Uncharacterized protein n=1 Tax=Araneus ventricosus TaxID=182803 RepID=A0A4Y2C9K6_ARAVE|nr:hypothetical protein AVEN_214094-1 [Araneus ventricosus]
MDLSTIEKALEARFGDRHLTQFYRTKLKTRRQKPGWLVGWGLMAQEPFLAKLRQAEARRKPSGISRRCGATNKPGLRRVPSGCSGKLSSPVLCRRYPR